MGISLQAITGVQASDITKANIFPAQQVQLSWKKAFNILKLWYPSLQHLSDSQDWMPSCSNSTKQSSSRGSFCRRT